MWSAPPLTLFVSAQASAVVRMPSASGPLTVCAGVQGVATGGSGVGRGGVPGGTRALAPWLALAFGAPVSCAFGIVSVALLRPPGSKLIPLTCGISFASAS